MGRDVDIPNGDPLAALAYFHLMVVHQVDVQFRTGGEGDNGVVVGLGHSGDIQFRITAVLVHPRVQVDVMGAQQPAVHFHGVVAGDIVIRVGPGYAFQAAGGSVGLHVHIDDVAGSEGDVLAARVFAVLSQLGPLAHGHRIGVVYGGIGINPEVFRQAAAVALGVVVNVHIRVGCNGLAVFRDHPCVFTDVYFGAGGDLLVGFDIRRNLDDATHGHVVVPGPFFVVAVIGTGLHLVFRQHIAVLGGELRALRKLRLGVHGDIVVGVGPGHAENAAGTGGGTALARHFLQGADVRAFRHIPGTFQGRGVGRLGFQGNGSRRAHGQDAAGIAVSEAPGGVAATGVDLQVFQQGCVAAVAALGGDGALVVAFRLGVAERNGKADAHRSIAQLAVAAGIVLGQKGQVCGAPRYRLGLFLTVFVGVLDFFLHGLIGLLAHVDGGFRIGDSLGLVGSAVRQGYADGPGIGIGHLLARLRVRVAYDGPGHHIGRVKGIAVVHRYLGFQTVFLAPGQGLAMIDGYARQAHRDGAGFRVDLRSVDRLHGDGFRRKDVAAVIDPDGGVAVGPALGHVHGIDARARAHAFGLGLYPTGTLGLDDEIATLFDSLGGRIAVLIRGLPGRGG